MTAAGVILRTPADLNWRTVQAVAYDNAKLTVAPGLLAEVDAGRGRFQALIDRGAACYGVTTGLGSLASVDLSELDDQARIELAHGVLQARAAAIGKPFAKSVVRAMLTIKLVNFLSGRDGVSAALCRFLVERLNDQFTPWVPSLGHGMAGDAIAHTHAFQTFIGAGFVLGDGGERLPADRALAARGVAPLELLAKEGLALLSGVAAAPACAIDVHRRLARLLRTATAVAAVSCEGAAVPKDAFHPALKAVCAEPGSNAVIDWLQPYFAASRVRPQTLQAAVSFRVIPQVHGALYDALTGLRGRVEAALRSFSGNPLLATTGQGDALLSVGLFHNQHLVNQAEQVAVALCHIGALSSRRLHRLLDAAATGLNPQLAARPGRDAGLVVTHKAALGLAARLKQLAAPGVDHDRREFGRPGRLHGLDPANYRPAARHGRTGGDDTGLRTAGRADGGRATRGNGRQGRAAGG